MQVLITGANGQDGKILRAILGGNHKVHLVCKASTNIEPIKSENVIESDIGDTSRLVEYILEKKIECILNTAAKSSVKESWLFSDEYSRVNFYAVRDLLGALIASGYQGRFFQFGSTDMFGQDVIRSLDMDMNPWSPYGESKVRAHEAVLNARSFGLLAYNLVLTNHDSNLRTSKFIMKRIALDFRAQIKTNFPVRIELENPEVRRDWADAFEICTSISRIIESSNPSDILLATGTSMSLREVVEKTARELDLEFVIQKKDDEVRIRDLISVEVNKEILPPKAVWNPKNVGHLNLLKMVRELVG